MGRPSSYTTEIFEEICERLCTGEPLEAICRDEGMPASRTVHGWLKGEVAGVPSTVSAAIARARSATIPGVEVAYQVLGSMSAPTGV